MIAQCLYQSDPKNLASMGRQRLACQRAARKLQWGVQKERISETNEPVPLLMRPAVKENSAGCRAAPLRCAADW